MKDLKDICNGLAWVAALCVVAVAIAATSGLCVRVFRLATGAEHPIHVEAPIE